MMYSEEQIEWIVGEVLRRLGVTVGREANGVAVGREVNHGRIHGELTISERVITLRLIEGRLSGISRLVVPPKAVITPAVKDELKARKIQLATSTSH